MLEVGTVVPDFCLPNQDEEEICLRDIKGRWIVLYFYPKDDTRGCTEEACNLRDNFSQLKKAGIVILGVSYDNAESHQKFSEKYKLPFPLLSDIEKKVAEAYGAKEENSGVPNRITYLIDGNGKILHIFDKVETANHTAQIIAVVNPKKEK